MESQNHLDLLYDRLFHQPLGFSLDLAEYASPSTLSLAPATVLIGLFPFFMLQYQHGGDVISSGRLLWAKLVAAIALVAVELVNMAVAITFAPVPSGIPIKEGLTRSVAAGCLLAMIYIAHRRTFRPSVILPAWSISAIICDMTALRLYTTSGKFDIFVALASVSVALKIILFALDELPKVCDIADAQTRNKTRWQATCGFLTRNLIIWPYEELSFGFQSVDSIRQLDPACSVERISERFSARWSSFDKSTPHCLTTCSIFTLRSFFLSTAVWRVLVSIFTFSQYAYIYCLVRFLENTDKGPNESTRFFVGAFIIYSGRVISDTSHSFSERRLVTLYRAVLNAAIYKKSLVLPKALTTTDASSINTNIEAIMGIIPSIYKSLAGVVSMALSLYLIILLYGTFSISIIGLVFCYKLTEWQIGKHMPDAQETWTESTELRKSQTSTILSQIEHTKLIGAEKAAFDLIDQCQQTEIKASIKTQFWTILLMAVVTSSSTFLGPALVASKLYWCPHLESQDLRNMSIAIGLVIDVASPLHHIIACTAHFRVLTSNMSCIQEYLVQREWTGEKESGDNSAPESEQQGDRPAQPENQIAQFSNASIAPLKSRKAALVNLCVSLARGEVLMVTGPPRSGKTTFLLSFLRESLVLQGSIHIKPGLIAYCGQVTWICNSTVRHNIIGSLAFNPTLYNLVLEGCCLKEDLDSLPQQDETMVGIGGWALTKEQEQKIALARAIYSQPDTIVVDEIFSVFNLSTANKVFARIFGKGGLLRNSLTTIVIATHNIPYLQHADYVLVIESDKTSTFQPYSLKPEFHRRLALVANRVEAASQTMKGNISDGTIKQEISTNENVQAEQEQIALSRRQALAFYVHSFPRLYLYLCIFLAVVAAIIEHGGTAYVLFWAETDIKSTALCIGFWLFTILNSLSTCTCLWLWFSKATPVSASSIQHLALDAVLRSEVEQLSTLQSDSFRQLFGDGISSLLSILPDRFIRFIYICGSAAYNIGIVSMGMHNPFVALLFTLGAIFIIYRNYFRVSRTVVNRESAKLIDNHFLETAAGLKYIRSFGWQKQQVQQMYYLLDKVQLSDLYTHCLDRWRKFSTGMLAFVVGLVVVVAAIHQEHSIPVVIISLISLSQYGQLTEAVVRMSADFDGQSGGLIHIHNFIASTPGERELDEEAVLPAFWPRNGKVLFENISIWHNRHENTAPPVLENVTAYVPGGWKVGIVGRPGSGKTSLILALLGFLKYSGRIVIDGVDISKVPRHVLRERIVTISQDSIELDGKVRSCLDPWGLRKVGRAGQNPTDEVMVKVLRRLKLWERISENGGLDGNMSDMEFTPDQRRMMCIARACIHRLSLGTRLVVVDDALANFHPIQYALVRRAMKEFMSDCTILMVVHRMESLTNVRMTIQIVFETAKVRIHQPMDDDYVSRDRELPPAMHDYGPVEEIPAELEEIVRLSEHGEESWRAQREEHQQGEGSRQQQQAEEQPPREREGDSEPNEQQAVEPSEEQHA